ncbi:hypothetical protein A3SI_06759 [Nitritalea halalkaliphila LW7]|uniref:DUF6817 domain-containing protein n=1 Tax=Nitritalea halalkaliphila LW7 TaxID=1189621 RepID=I5C615_9BACT|nr:HD domain-containing protein [Nitritalea halalkaliphila]EIM77267.1 hypothetical protein A3SI_06759 [Nitritalea halalkaliphila LW7]
MSLHQFTATQPAQTNLQLYMQMLREGYSEADVQQINEAYFFTLKKVNGMYRGSGKPFICHLVGTASLMVRCRRPLDVVLAALMHALYQDRVPFEGCASISERRTQLASLFSAECDRLVHLYTHFEMTRITEIDPADTSLDEDVLLLRLADELEDLVDFSLCLHGKLGDTEKVGGSFLSRKARKQQELAVLKRIAKQLGVDELYDALDYWMDFSKYETYPAPVKSGYYSSFEL